MQASNLGGSAQELLDEFVKAILAINPDYPLPGGRYVGAGEIPWDGPGLYVYLGQGYTGQPGRRVSASSDNSGKAAAQRGCSRANRGGAAAGASACSRCRTWLRSSTAWDSR